MSFFEKAKRIKTIADIGLLYYKTEYDKERYQELQEISNSMLSDLLNITIEELKQCYIPVSEYPTVKVDVRGLILDEQHNILLVKEQSDGKWSLPGGWAEPGFSPKEAITKEVREETGLHIIVKSLLGLFDIRMHPHPPTPYSIYKIILNCSAEDFRLNKGFDILDVDFFSIDNLPPLSQNRILESQIRIVYKTAIESLSPVID